MTRKTTCKHNGKTYTLDGCLCGDYRELTLLDPLKQMAYQPKIRKDVIYTNDFRSLAKLFSELTYFLNRNYTRDITTNPYYTLQHDANKEYTFKFKLPDGGVAGTAGNPVTVEVAAEDQYNGMSQARAGHDVVFIGQLDDPFQNAHITSVTDTGTAIEVVLQPYNNEALDFTGKAYYTATMYPFFEYVACDTDPIPTERTQETFPHLVKQWIRQYETGLCFNQNELNRFSFEKDLEIIDGYDPATGKARPMISMMHHMKDLIFKAQMQEAMLAMFGATDHTTNTGQDGIMNLAMKGGSLDISYNADREISIINAYKHAARKITKGNGPKQYMNLHDIEFGLARDEGRAQLIAAYNQNYTFSLFGTNPSNFSYFQFKDFSYAGVDWREMCLSGLDEPAWGGSMLNGFGLLVPAKKYRTSGGNSVPPISIVQMAEGMDSSYNNKTWSDDTRARGEREFKVYKRFETGFEKHAICHLGVMRSDKC